MGSVRSVALAEEFVKMLGSATALLGYLQGSNTPATLLVCVSTVPRSMPFLLAGACIKVYSFVFPEPPPSESVTLYVCLFHALPYSEYKFNIGAFSISGEVVIN